MWYVTVILMAKCIALKLPLRIYNGTDANASEYNCVVRIEIQRNFRVNSSSIRIRHEHLCTASALSPIWVISAAHCLEDLDLLHSGRLNSIEKLVIRYGHVKDLPTNPDSFSKVLFAVMHPLYSPLYTNGFRYHSQHDIVLLKTSPMNINSYIKLSAVDYKSAFGHEAIVAGFGITTKTMPTGKIKTDSTLRLKKPLQVLKVVITKCDLDHVTTPGLCIQPKCDHVAALCGGDSGGPIIHPSGLIGVLSECDATGYCLYSVEKIRVDVAGIIVPTSGYIEWIYNYINAS